MSAWRRERRQLGQRGEAMCGEMGRESYRTGAVRPDATRLELVAHGGAS